MRDEQLTSPRSDLAMALEPKPTTSSSYAGMLPGDELRALMGQAPGDQLRGMIDRELGFPSAPIMPKPKSPTVDASAMQSQMPPQASMAGVIPSEPIAVPSGARPSQRVIEVAPVEFAPTPDRRRVIEIAPVQFGPTPAVRPSALAPASPKARPVAEVTPATPEAASMADDKALRPTYEFAGAMGAASGQPIYGGTPSTTSVSAATAPPLEPSAKQTPAPAVAPAQAPPVAGKVEPPKGAEVQVKPAQEAAAKKAAEELAPSERGAAAAQVPGAPTTMDPAAMVKGIQTSFSQEYLQKREAADKRIAEIDEALKGKMSPEQKVNLTTERKRLIEEQTKNLSLSTNELVASTQKMVDDINAYYGSDVANKTREHFANIDRHIATIERNAEQAASLSVDPNRPFKDQSGKSWIAAIAIGLGEFGRSLTKGNVNLASHIIDKMVNDDIEAQKVEIDQARGKVKDAQNALAAVERTGVPKLQAEAMVRDRMLAAVQSKIQQIGMSAENEQIRVRANVMNGLIGEDRDRNLAQIAAARASFIAQQRKMIADAEKHKVELDLKRAHAEYWRATGRAAEARALTAGQGEAHHVFDPITNEHIGFAPTKQDAERQASLNNAVAGLQQMIPIIQNLQKNTSRLGLLSSSAIKTMTGDPNEDLGKLASVLMQTTPLLTAGAGEKAALGILKKAEEQLLQGKFDPQTLQNLLQASVDSSARIRSQAQALAAKGASMQAKGIPLSSGGASAQEALPGMPATPDEDKE